VQNARYRVAIALFYLTPCVTQSPPTVQFSHLQQTKRARTLRRLRSLYARRVPQAEEVDAKLTALLDQFRKASGASRAVVPSPRRASCGLCSGAACIILVPACLNCGIHGQPLLCSVLEQRGCSLLTPPLSSLALSVDRAGGEGMDESLPGLLQEARYLRQLCDRIVAASPVAAAGGSSGSSAGGSSAAAAAAGGALPSAAPSTASSAGLPPLPPAYQPHAGGGGRSGFASAAVGPSSHVSALTARPKHGPGSPAAAGGASSSAAGGNAGIGAGYSVPLASYSAPAGALSVTSSASTGVGGGVPGAAAAGPAAAEAAAATGAEEGPTPEMLHDFLNAAYTDAAGVYKGDYQATGAASAVADAAAAAVRAAGIAGAGSFGALTGSAGLQYQLPDGAPLRFGAGAAGFYPSYGAAASALGLGQHPFQHAAAAAPGVSQMPSAADSGADAALAQLRDRVRATQQGAAGASGGLDAAGATEPAPQ